MSATPISAGRGAQVPMQRAARRGFWFDRLMSLLAEEFALGPRRFRTALRMAVIGTVGAALMVVCHVYNQLGAYLVWLMIGPVAMMSPRKALAGLLILSPVIAASVPLAGILSESPWLMLAFLFVFTAISTWLNIKLELGGLGLVIQVVTLNTFYGVIYAPDDFGWGVGALWGGCILAFSLISLFDTWLWPDPAESILPVHLAASVARNRRRFVSVASYYFAEPGSMRPPEPPFTSGMPMQLALLERARAEGTSALRRAVLLAAISREERLHILIDGLTVAVRERVPTEMRTMFQPEIEAAVAATAAALDELEHETLTDIRTGADNPPSAAAVRARDALDKLDARTIELRPIFTKRISAAEVANVSAFTDTLQEMVRLIARPLDIPPENFESPPAKSSYAAVLTSDPAAERYCAKVALCIVISYVIGLTTHEPNLSTILTTVIITALPTYGATVRKMILRIIGAFIGGVISLATIIVVTPNFSTLPSYMIAIFIVLLLSAYASLSSGRIAYAGKQIATTYLLIFADLSPTDNIYSPLWRMWGIFLGTFVVAIIFILLWPDYSGHSLLPRLRKVIRDALALAPDPAITRSTSEISALNRESMQLLSQILEVAEDARIEGRSSLVDHESVVLASGTLRRITNRFAGLATVRSDAPLPPLDEVTQRAHDATYAALRTRLKSWLDFYESKRCLDRDAAMAEAASHSRTDIAQSLETFANRLGEDGFAKIAPWRLAQRRQIFAELESMRRLEFLSFELNGYLARVPAGKLEPPPALVLSEAPQGGS